MHSDTSEEDRAWIPRRKPPNDQIANNTMGMGEMNPVNGTRTAKRYNLNGNSRTTMDTINRDCATLKSNKARCIYLINHEFRALQLDKQMAAMSVFDLIDYCAALFERSTIEKNNDANEAFRLYVRSYLIFNYFVNTFIMLHFNGFAKFMELSPQDFIIYLNLYNFYRSDEILGRHAFQIPPENVREWSLEYLASKKLLTFDPDLLYGWLDEYVEYMKNKERIAGMSEETDKEQENEDLSDNDIFEFSSRFPELSLPYKDTLSIIPASKSPNMRHSTTSASPLIKAPYPILNGVPPETPLPYPIELEMPFMSAESGAYSRARPPPPIPVPTSKVTHVSEFPFEVPINAPRRQTLADPSLTLNQGHHDTGTGNTRNRILDAFIVPPHTKNIRQNNKKHNSLAYSRPSTMTPTSPNPGFMGSPRPHTGSNGSQISEIEFRRIHAICGMKNMGSSCYINSTVQVLIGLAKFETTICTSKKKSSPQPLTDATAGLIKTFNANGGAHILPSKFLRILASLKPDFQIPFQQQDAQEFLLFMLDKLHEELSEKPRDDNIDYLAKWNISVNPRDKDDYLKWYRDLLGHEGESVINDTFQGHVQSKLMCNKCGHRSVSYSSFTILSLPIPGGNKQTIDLTDCLRYYTQDEVLTGENAWNCPKCNNTTQKENPMDIVFQPKRGLFRLKRSKSPTKKNSVAPAAPTSISIKQLSFIKLPSVMFIHLSRFSMAGVTDKLNTPISYPLRLKFNHSAHDIYYNLTGLINHYGSMKSGHYTSLVNKARGHGEHTDTLLHPFWCIFDDEVVNLNVKHGSISSTEHSKLHSQDVYVLCYERVYD